MSNFKGADNIYYNVQVFNNAKDQLITASYTDNRVSVILDNPSLYYMAVVRFKIPAVSIPIMIFRDNYYGISLRYAGVTYPKPADPVQFIPYIPVTLGDNNLIFYFQDFLDMVNSYLTYLYNQVVADNPADPNVPANPPLPAFQSSNPFFTYDPKTQLISLYALRIFGEENPNHMQIFFNTELQSILQFQNFAETTFFYPQVLPQQLYLIRVFNTGFNQNLGTGLTNGVPNTDNPYGENYYVMTQQLISLFLFNSFNSIVFTSNNIAVRAEQLPGPPQVPQPGTASAQGTTSGSDNTLSVLTDFEPLQVAFDKSYFQYYPQGPYRYYDLISTEPLRNLNITVKWTDQFGDLHPVFLLPGDVFTMKILFRRKGSDFVFEG